jgi:hypothetical protein
MVLPYQPDGQIESDIAIGRLLIGKSEVTCWNQAMLDYLCSSGIDCSEGYISLLLLFGQIVAIQNSDLLQNSYANAHCNLETKTGVNCRFYRTFWITVCVRSRISWDLMDNKHYYEEGKSRSSVTENGLLTVQ